MLTSKEYAMFEYLTNKFIKQLNKDYINDLLEMLKTEDIYILTDIEKKNMLTNISFVIIKIERILEKTKLKNTHYQGEVVKLFKIVWDLS